MAPVYLFDLYESIDEQIKKVTAFLESGSGISLSDKKFAEGQLTALQEIKQFLSESYNIKLPKRLRKKLQSEQ